MLDGIACDSDGNVYVSGSMDSGANLRKYNSSGALQWAVAAEGDEVNPFLNEIVINNNDDIFVVGKPIETPPTSSTYHSIFKWNTSGVFQTSKPIGSTGSGSDGTYLCTDTLGNVFAANNLGHLEKFNASLVSQWGNDDMWGGLSKIFCDAQNRVHWLGATSGGKYAHGIRNKDGGLDFGTDYNQGFMAYGAVCCKEVYYAHYTDQATTRRTPDMCCFLDATIPHFKLVNEPYDVDDIVWKDYLALEGTDWGFEDRTGVFKCITAGKTSHPINLQETFEQLSLSPPGENANWDTYTDDDGTPFGGIGACPQIYTVTFYGLLKVSDSSPSEYNGEYLLIRGPGTYGFFFGVQHDSGTRINFTVHPESGVDTLEKLHFGTDALPSCIFKYETASNHDEKLTEVANDNTIVTADAVAYDGYGSMYPGKRPRWDAITVWPVDRIVAWQGRFFKALNENSNSQPPSGDWAVL